MLTIVYDNYEGEPGFERGWGFGCVVQGYEKTVLFDTGGSGDTLMHNLAKAGIEPNIIDAVVISHNHWDHAGGLDRFLTANPGVALYPPAPVSRARRAKIESEGGRVEHARESSEVCPGVRTTRLLGTLLKEQALSVETERGVVVLTGCAHPGVVELVRSAAETTGKTPYAVLGGFHLKDSSHTQVMQIVEGLRDAGIVRPGPSHCTGDAAIEKISEAFGDNFVKIGVGCRLGLPDLT